MRKKKRERITIEWKKGSSNVACFIPWPISILFDYIQNKNPLEIADSFFSRDLKQINLLDLCILTVFWSESKKIIAARSSWFKHPTHHSSEFIFDKEKKRLIIKMRQPDLDGKHWKNTHVHIIRGQIDPENKCNILKPDFDKHIKLLRTQIAGKWIMNIK